MSAGRRRVRIRSRRTPTARLLHHNLVGFTSTGASVIDRTDRRVALRAPRSIVLTILLVDLCSVPQGVYSSAWSTVRSLARVLLTRLGGFDEIGSINMGSIYDNDKVRACEHHQQAGVSTSTTSIASINQFLIFLHIHPYLSKHIFSLVVRSHNG